MGDALTRRLTALARGPWLPRRTVRLKLALLYGFAFTISGALLLGITIALVVGFHQSSSSLISSARPGPPGTSAHIQTSVVASSQHADLQLLFGMSAIALAVMAAASVWFGWVVAGRVLRPLRTITAAAREISASSLDRRLALEGPDDELKELADTFDGLLARLDASFAAQRRFVANASHELRTPLARLKTLTQVALADPEADEGSLRAAHERVLASERRLEQLIDALLALAGGERTPAQRQPIDLATLTGDVLRARRPEIQRRELQLTTTLDRAGALGDPRLVERLVENIVDNAVLHNTEHGGIDVSTATVEGRAVLSVANTGPVISPSDVERLAQPFQRLDGSRAAHGDGHGLGLSIVQAIAVAHGATVATRAQPAGGLSVEVQFPGDLPSSPDGF